MENKEKKITDEIEENRIDETESTKVSDDEIDEVLKEVSTMYVASETVDFEEESLTEEALAESFEETEIDDEENNEEDFDDEDEDEEEEKPKKSIFKKIFYAFAILFAFIFFLVLVAGGIGIWYVNNKLNNIGYDEATTLNYNELDFIEAIDDEDLVDLSIMGDAAGDDYREILKNWATNGGEKISSSNVTNILLIGSDASVKYPLRATVAEKGNTDAMILISINKKEQTIKLVSFMRDSYVYMHGFDSFAKLNAACANGGPGYLVEVIENNYKIKIDGYVLIGIDSFEKVINLVDGIDIAMTDTLRKELNRVYLRKNPIKAVPEGEKVHLDGEQAFHFSKARRFYATGDVIRVQHQRMVITALIEKCKGASLSQIDSVLDTILKNVRTNIPKKDIVNYATTAITDGWANYKITTDKTFPCEAARKGYSAKSWIWVIDFPYDAQTLQKELYGVTNIDLPKDRTTALDVIKED